MGTEFQILDNVHIHSGKSLGTAKEIDPENVVPTSAHEQKARTTFSRYENKIAPCRMMARRGIKNLKDDGLLYIYHETDT